MSEIERKRKLSIEVDDIYTYIYSEATSLGEGKLRLKIDLVSYPARAEGLVNMIYMYSE